MKKPLILLLVLCFAAGVQAQPQLAGLTSVGGANSGGTAIQYLGGAGSINTFYSLPAGGCPGCGASPYGSLLKASNSELYGLTVYDGAYYGGTLFQYDYPSNTYTILTNFNITNTGYYPEGSLMQASNGLLYGMTSNGGANGSGTLFSYAIGSDSVIVLVNMPTSSNFTRYNSLIQSRDGNLYGISAYDGLNSSGSIFRYNIATNTFSVLYNLPAHATPFGDLLELGTDTFYGLTYGDGAYSGGTIFRFTTATASYSVVYDFSTPTGSHPGSSLIRATNGLLYGTTSAGGADSAGVLFSFAPATGIYTDVHDFIDSLGGYPEGSPFQASDGVIYGMTTSGGDSINEGVIYSYNINSSAFTYETSFNLANGGDPLGHLTEYILIPTTLLSPVSQSSCVGGTASFFARATRYASVQWQISTNGGATFSDIAGATDSIYSFTVTSAMNGDEYRAIFTNVVGSDTTPAATLSLYAAATDTFAASICQGQTYAFGGHFYTVSGTYSDTMHGASVHGCDSIATVHLTAYAPGYNTLTTSACGSYTLGTHTFTASGSYADTLVGASAHGCDSIFTLDLTIYNPSYNFITTYRCPGQVFTIGSNTYSTSGTFVDTITGATAHGCDSIVTLNLTVYAPAASTITQSLCQGQTYTIGGHTYGTSGTYADTLHGASVHGCDSTVTLQLTVYPVATATIHASICSGQPYTWGNHTYTIPGTYTDTLPGAAAHGCDSIITLIIAANQPSTSTVNASICQGGEFKLGNNIFTTAGTYVDTLAGASVTGCDSIVTLYLTVYPPSSATVSAAICLGQEYYIGTYVYSTPGTYTHTIQGGSVHGCDSTVTLYLTVNEPAVNSISATICQGQSYTFGAASYSVSGTYSDTLSVPSSAGCDSINQLHLTVTDIDDTVTTNGAACTSAQDGASYQWVDCSSDKPVTGGTGQTYIARQNGNYKCVVTLGTCVDTTACVNVTDAGIADAGVYEFQLYPNPANGSFTIEHNYTGAIAIEVMSLLGEDLKMFSLSGSKGIFDISDLPSGIYLVRIHDDRQTLTMIKLVED